MLAAILSFLAQLFTGVIKDALQVFRTTKVESAESTLDLPATPVDVLIDKFSGL